MNRGLMVFCMWLFFISSFAQDTITVHKDPRLDILTAKQSAINRLTAKMTGSGQFRGYRLQVLTSRSRDEAFNTKAAFLQNSPDQKAYVLYQSPNFKVRIGNFLEKADAEKFKNELTKWYNKPAYIVEDIIEYTPKEEE